MRARLTAGHVINPDAPSLSRRHVVEACHQQLERDSYPRLHMTVLIVLTAGVGWLASSILLATGMEDMWLRYPVALAIAYAGFLVFLWLWLRRHNLDVPDGILDGIANGAQPCGRCSGTFQGGGGQFGGGGASGSFDGTSGDLAGSAAGGAGDVLGAADEVAIPIIALVAAAALILGLAFASIYVVYTAPSLLAELTVDAALSYTLLRRIKRAERRVWLGTAIARTWLPALCTAVFLAAIGAAVALWAPETTSLAGALHRLFGG